MRLNIVFAGIVLFATVLGSALAQTPPPVQNVPLVNDSGLPSGLNISNMASAPDHRR